VEQSFDSFDGDEHSIIVAQFHISFILFSEFDIFDAEAGNRRWDIWSRSIFTSS